MLEQHRRTVLHGDTMQRCLRIRVSTWDQSGETVSTLSKRSTPFQRLNWSFENMSWEQEAVLAASKVLRTCHEVWTSSESRNADGEIL